MINLNDKINELFPGIHTKQGKLKKGEPHKYECSNCKSEFSKTKKLNFSWISFGLKECPSCGCEGKDSIKYNVWKRAINNEIVIEDFILNTVTERGNILKEELEQLVLDAFGDEGKYYHYGIKGLSTLVYYGYLNVDKDKRDNDNIVEYSIGQKLDLENRFELVR